MTDSLDLVAVIAETLRDHTDPGFYTSWGREDKCVCGVDLLTTELAVHQAEAIAARLGVEQVNLFPPPAHRIYRFTGIEHAARKAPDGD